MDSNFRFLVARASNRHGRRDCSADQNTFLQLAPQKRCGEPPCRVLNGRSHHLHNFEDPSVITETVSVRHIVHVGVILRQSANSTQ
jgi:hypothetical protein